MTFIITFLYSLYNLNNLNNVERNVKHLIIIIFLIFSVKETSLIKSVKRFGAMVASKLPFINLKTVVKVAVVATCFCLVAIQANKG